MAPKKKIVKRAPGKQRAAAPVVAATAPAAGSCACACKCGGFGRFVKKLIVFAIIFALGFAACRFCCGEKRFGKRGFHKDMFVGECLDMSKVKCPEMAKNILVADVNADGCVSKEEFKTWKQAQRDVE